MSSGVGGAAPVSYRLSADGASLQPCAASASVNALVVRWLPARRLIRSSQASRAAASTRGPRNRVRSAGRSRGRPRDDDHPMTSPQDVPCVASPRTTPTNHYQARAHARTPRIYPQVAHRIPNRLLCILEEVIFRTFLP